VIQAGYPLLVEKPLVFSLQEADVLLAEAAKRGLFMAINFNHRYARPVQMAREAIAAGRLGRIAFATWRFGGNGGNCPHHENLIETQCHGFDMLEFLCGPIESLAAQMTEAEGMQYSTLALALRFASGAVGQPKVFPTSMCRWWNPFFKSCGTPVRSVKESGNSMHHVQGLPGRAFTGSTTHAAHPSMVMRWRL
jgi:predicted dehydrogenase